MTTANPSAPTSPLAMPAQILFFSRLHTLQPRQRTGRVSNWPFPASRDHGLGDGHAQDDIRAQAARVLRTTAAHWWPAES